MAARPRAEVLRRLAEALPEDNVVLSDLIRHPNTPLEVAVGVALRKDFLRGELPPAVLAHMPRDPRREVRLVSAEHPPTPAEALARIVRASLGLAGARAPSLQVLRVRRRGTPARSLLARLARDRSCARALPGRRQPRARRPALSRASGTRTSSCAPRSLDARPALRDAVLAELGDADLYAIRHEVPEAALGRLARHADGRVRAAVAAHDLAWPRLLERLARDERPEVREAVSENPFMGGVLNEEERAAIARTLARAARRAKGPRTRPY
ncbi:MAG: hypothetical protein IPG04_41995 [Polyangiaceae bacterium]|nr:hypothetical protein [Polyangiaceae bacterium]